MMPLLTTELALEMDAALSAPRPCEAGERVGCHGNNPARWYGLLSCGCPTQTWCDQDRAKVLAWSGDLYHVSGCGLAAAVRWEPMHS